MPQDIYSSIEESLSRIEESLQQEQKRGGRTHEIDYYNKEIKKVKKYNQVNLVSSTITATHSPRTRKRLSR